MAEFKFSCPQCGQHIQCDIGYSGAQINCPSCKQAIIVPQAPRSAAPPPAPIPPQAPPPLSTRQTTSAPAAGQRFGGAPGVQPSLKAKSNTLKTVLIITAAIVVLAALGGGGWFGYSKYKAKQDAKKGNPAAQVPVATAAASSQALGIMSKVHDAYTNLNSLDVSGTSVTVIDMSQVTAADVNPDAKNKNAARRAANIPKGMTNSMEVSIKLMRPESYSIEGTGKMEMGRTKMTNTIAIWSSDTTNYSLMIMGTYKKYSTVKDRNSAFMMNGQAGGLAMAIPQMFFGEESPMSKFISDWQQTGDESLSGQDCYTILAKMMGQKMKLWVSKSSYMILQSQITLGAPVSDADIEGMIGALDTNTNKTQAQLDQQKKMAQQQAAMMTKIRGTVTETYDNVQANPTLTADDFVYSVPRGIRLTPAP